MGRRLADRIRRGLAEEKAIRPTKDKRMNVGFWAWSRYPPYFGEILCWWDIFTFLVVPALGGIHSSSARSVQLGSLVSPLLRLTKLYHLCASSSTHLRMLNLLLFASGVPTAEKPTAQRFYKMAYPDDDSDNGHDFHERQYVNGAWANYQTYRVQTSILVPLLPAVYRVLPLRVKRTFLRELPMSPGKAS